MICSKQEFEKCLKDENKLFALTSIYITPKTVGDFFYGNINQFKERFFSNLTFEIVRELADEYDCYINIEKVDDNTVETSMDTNFVRSEDPVLYHADKLPSVLFAHGKESGPWGEKIKALADVARSHGYAVNSPDFRGMDDPEERVTHLLQVASEMQEPFILVGSSMGGYVALRASRKLPTLGLFLMVPAVGCDGYQVPRPIPGCKRMTIVQAWQDKVIPVHNVIEYAQRHHAELHLVNSDHHLSGQISLLACLFDRFLERGR